jgi:dihydrofolate reductase
MTARAAAAPSIALVAAVAENGVIGAGGRLAWRIADDMRWFRKVTMGKPVVMGRKTFASIGKALPGRDNIVVSRDGAWRAQGAVRAASVEEALAIAAASARARGVDEICVIGGGEIYAQTLARADRIYLTRVAARVAGDVLFPQIDPGRWSESAQGECAAGPKNDYPCRFVVLDRVSES